MKKKRIPTCPYCKSPDVHVEIRSYTYRNWECETIPDTKFRCCSRCKNSDWESLPFEICE